MWRPRGLAGGSDERTSICSHFLSTHFYAFVFSFLGSSTSSCNQRSILAQTNTGRPYCDFAQGTVRVTFWFWRSSWTSNWHWPMPPSTSTANWSFEYWFVLAVDLIFVDIGFGFGRTAGLVGHDLDQLENGDSTTIATITIFAAVATGGLRWAPPRDPGSIVFTAPGKLFIDYYTSCSVATQPPSTAFLFGLSGSGRSFRFCFGSFGTFLAALSSGSLSCTPLTKRFSACPNSLGRVPAISPPPAPSLSGVLRSHWIELRRASHADGPVSSTGGRPVDYFHIEDLGLRLSDRFHWRYQWLCKTRLTSGHNRRPLPEMAALFI